MQVFKKKSTFVDDELTISTAIKLLSKSLRIKASQFFVQLDHIFRDARKVNRPLLNPIITQEAVTSF